MRHFMYDVKRLRLSQATIWEFVVRIGNQRSTMFETAALFFLGPTAGPPHVFNFGWLMQATGFENIGDVSIWITASCFVTVLAFWLPCDVSDNMMCGKCLK